MAPVSVAEPDTVQDCLELAVSGEPVVAAASVVEPKVARSDTCVVAAVEPELAGSGKVAVAALLEPAPSGPEMFIAAAVEPGQRSADETAVVMPSTDLAADKVTAGSNSHAAEAVVEPSQPGRICVELVDAEDCFGLADSDRHAARRAAGSDALRSFEAAEEVAQPRRDCVELANSEEFPPACVSAHHELSGDGLVGSGALAAAVAGARSNLTYSDASGSDEPESAHLGLPPLRADASGELELPSNPAGIVADVEVSGGDRRNSFCSSHQALSDAVSRPAPPPGQLPTSLPPVRLARAAFEVPESWPQVVNQTSPHPHTPSSSAPSSGKASLVLPGVRPRSAENAVGPPLPPGATMCSELRAMETPLSSSPAAALKTTAFAQSPKGAPRKRSVTWVEKPQEMVPEPPPDLNERHDDLIPVDESVAGYAAMTRPKTPQERAEEAKRDVMNIFERFDRSGKGSIRPADLAAVLRILNPSKFKNNDALYAILGRAGLLDGGGISMNKFLDFIWSMAERTETRKSSPHHRGTSSAPLLPRAGRDAS